MYKKTTSSCKTCPPFSLAKHTSSSSAETIVSISDKLCVYLVLSEGLACTLGDRTFPVPPGSALLFHTMDLQRLAPDPDLCPDFRLLSIAPEDLEALSTDTANLLDCFFYRPFASAQFLPLEEQDVSALLSVWDKLERLNSGDDSAYGISLYKRTLLTELFLLLNIRYHSFHAIDDAASPDRCALIYSVVSYIHSNYYASISSEHLSDDFAINKFALSNTFRQLTGATISQYVTDCRMLKAKELLLKGVRVETVCGEIGYINLSHFSRAFKNYTGKSPKQFQMAYRKGCMPSKRAQISLQQNRKVEL